jgi:hypothetical protein
LVLIESAIAFPPLAVILFHPSFNSLMLVALMSNISATDKAPLSDIRFYPRLNILKEELLVKRRASQRLES